MVECFQGQPFLPISLLVMKGPKEGRKWVAQDQMMGSATDRKGRKFHLPRATRGLPTASHCPSWFILANTSKACRGSFGGTAAILYLVWSFHPQADSRLSVLLPFWDCSCLVWSSEDKDAGKQFKVSLMDGNALSLPFKVSAQPLWANS